MILCITTLGMGLILMLRILTLCGWSMVGNGEPYQTCGHMWDEEFGLMCYSSSECMWGIAWCIKVFIFLGQHDRSITGGHPQLPHKGMCAH